MTEVRKARELGSARAASAIARPLCCIPVQISKSIRVGCAQEALPEPSEDTVNCSGKPAGAVSADMLCEESVCSADEEADARPDKKRRTGAPASVQCHFHRACTLA